jgi:hypothetical protein
LPKGTSPEIPVDFVQPGTEGEYRAFTNPGKGYIPAMMAVGDKFTLATIKNTNAVEWDLEYAANARWDVIGRYFEMLTSSFVKKINDDCWHTILAAVADRGLTVYDAGAGVGKFTKKLFSLSRVAMARNAGGNQSSIKKGKLTDVFLSPEGIEEILNWTLAEVPDGVREQLYSMSGDDNTTLTMLNVKLHEMYELGVDQEYQDYYDDTLAADLVPVIGSTHTVADVELAIGMDLKNRDSFVRLITRDLELFDDIGAGGVLHRSQKGGAYGHQSHGVAVLDSRRAFAISY